MHTTNVHTLSLGKWLSKLFLNQPLLRMRYAFLLYQFAQMEKTTAETSIYFFQLLESRFSYLRNNNFSPGFVSRDITGTKENQCIHFLPAITDSSRYVQRDHNITLDANK